jgi:hypothetical protein
METKSEKQIGSERFISNLVKNTPPMLKEGSVPIGHPISTLGSHYNDLLKALPPSSIVIVDGQIYAVPI